MSLPSIADQIGLAVGVARREARIEARRQAPQRPQPPKPRRHVIPPRTRILLALGDGRPHRWGRANRNQRLPEQQRLCLGAGRAHPRRPRRAPGSPPPPPLPPHPKGRSHHALPQRRNSDLALAPHRLRQRHHRPGRRPAHRRAAAPGAPPRHRTAHGRRRRRGTPRDGYYIAASGEELEATCQFLRSRAMHSLVLESRLRNVPLPDLIGQMKLPT
ncbi:MAG: hypothetical protein M5R42_16810 [Rhodocyclaceae bacterium]|nr:hypothetical protein [Rhodocyclaceae bacterium]